MVKLKALRVNCEIRALVDSLLFACRQTWLHFEEAIDEKILIQVFSFPASDSLSRYCNL